MYSIDWDSSFEGIDKCADIMTVNVDDIIEEFGRPDVIWASPDCTTYSVAAISRHRRKNKETGNLDPVTEYATYCDSVNSYVVDLIKDLDPTVYFIENPRGGLRKMSFM